MAVVRRLLGPGTPVSGCAPDPKLKPGDCPPELAYGDGANMLKVSFSGADDRVTIVKIDLGAHRPGVATARVPHGAFATWTWAGNRIDRLPKASTAGWSGTIEPAHKDCFVEFHGPAQSGGAVLVASYQCAPGSERIAEFSIGVTDP